MEIEKKTNRNSLFKDFIAQGTQVGNILHLAGQVGANMGNIVDETFFVTDINEFMESVGAANSDGESATVGVREVSQTIVQVAELVKPELKLEIKCIAHL